MTGSSPRATSPAHLIAEGPQKVFHLGPERDLPLLTGSTSNWSERTRGLGGRLHRLLRRRDGNAARLSRHAAAAARPRPAVHLRQSRTSSSSAATGWSPAPAPWPRSTPQLGGEHPDRRQAARADLCEALARAEAARGARRSSGRASWPSATACRPMCKGAIDFGLDLLYISGGIHAREYGTPGQPDSTKLACLSRRARCRPSPPW